MTITTNCTYVGFDGCTPGKVIPALIIITGIIIVIGIIVWLFRRTLFKCRGFP